MFNKIFIVTIKINRKKILISLLILLLISFLTIFLSRKTDINVFNVFKTNKIVVIDPGHGGIDGGAFYGKILEKNINLDVGLKLKEVLIKNRIKVVMTREKDVSLEDKSFINDTRYKRDLDGRKNIINNSGADIFISLHVNSNSYTSKARGIVIYHYPGSEEGEKLAKLVSEFIDTIVYEEHLNSKSLKTKVVAEDYFILRESKIPGILVEMGFITNPQDRTLLQNKKYKEKITLAIGKGIIEYMKHQK